MTKSVKKLINKEVYEKDAENPWARIKDFIIADDGKSVKGAVLSTESLIPLCYEAELESFESISDTAVLKEDVRPKPIDTHYEDLKSFGKIKNKKIFSDGKTLKIKDMYFDTELGEITDFVAEGLPLLSLGKKYFYTPEEAAALIRRGRERQS